MQVVVCGSSALARSFISEAIEGSGGHVLAELDTAFEAASVAERFAAEVLVLDLDVQLALGQHPLDDLDRPGRTYHLIISADRPAEIDPDRPNLTVVSRHDRSALMKALTRLSDVRGQERRRRPEVKRHSPTVMGNLSSSEVFFNAMNESEAGDVLMMLAIPDSGALERLLQVCSQEVRSNDHVMRQSTEVVIFMPGGDNLGHGAALARIRDRWPKPDELIVRRAVLGEIPASVVFSSELRSIRAEQQPLDSVS